MCFLFPQVLPGRVLSLYQHHFLLTPSTFDLFLPRDGGSNVAKGLEIHQTVDPVLLGESFLDARPVLEPSSCQVVRDPGVEGARPARQNVNAIEPVSQKQLRIPRAG